MSRNTSRYVGFFVTGVGAGAIGALLLAPRSGAQTRRYLRRRLEEGKEYLADKTRDVGEHADEFVWRGRHWLMKGKECLAAALETGKHSYHATVRR